MPPPARLWLALYLVDSLVEVVAEGAGWSVVSFVATALAMPLLAAAWIVGSAGRPPVVRRLVVAALVFSWLGDVFGVTILLKIGFFAFAQACYIAVFSRWVRRAAGAARGPTARRFWLARVAYLVVVGGLVTVVVPGSRALAPAVVGYGLLVGLMAVAALSVHRLTGIGAAVFLVSDTVIALDAFVGSPSATVSAVVIMATYLLAQLLIVLGLLRAAVPVVGDGGLAD